MTRTPGPPPSRAHSLSCPGWEWAAQTSGPVQPSPEQVLSRHHRAWKASRTRGTVLDPCPLCPCAALRSPLPLEVYGAHTWDSWVQGLCLASGSLLLWTLGSGLAAEPAGPCGVPTLVSLRPQSRGRPVSIPSTSWWWETASEWSALSPHLSPSSPPLPQGVVLGSCPVEVSSGLPASWQGWHPGLCRAGRWACGDMSQQQRPPGASIPGVPPAAPVPECPCTLPPACGPGEPPS